MAYDIEQLLRMTQAQLDELFTASPAGDIPDGEGKGTAIIAAGTGVTSEIAGFINHFAWQGKIFDAKAGLLKNKILPFGIAAIVARVYKGESWFDGKECIVLDYSQTSLVARLDSRRNPDDRAWFLPWRGVWRQDAPVPFRAAVLTAARSESCRAARPRPGGCAPDDRPSPVARRLPRRR